MKKEIPKIIHYCWFGNGDMDDEVNKCITSWKKYFPTYQLMIWNEETFDVNICQYSADAYKEGKWAHVSDVARFYALYNYGGLYFDTDVEVISSFDNIIENGGFMGVETTNETIAPGLGMGVFMNDPIIGRILDEYFKSDFYDKYGNAKLYETVVVKTTNIFIEKGFKFQNKPVKIDDITIYPKEFFNPMDYKTGEINLSDVTHSIHWYSGSWLPKSDKIIHEIEMKIYKVMPKPFAKITCFIYRKGYRILEKMKIL